MSMFIVFCSVWGKYFVLIGDADSRITAVKSEWQSERKIYSSVSFIWSVFFFFYVQLVPKIWHVLFGVHILDLIWLGGFENLILSQQLIS